MGGRERGVVGEEGRGKGWSVRSSPASSYTDTLPQPTPTKHATPAARSPVRLLVVRACTGSHVYRIPRRSRRGQAQIAGCPHPHSRVAARASRRIRTSCAGFQTRRPGSIASSGRRPSLDIAVCPVPRSRSSRRAHNPIYPTCLRRQSASPCTEAARPSVGTSSACARSAAADRPVDLAGSERGCHWYVAPSEEDATRWPASPAYLTSDESRCYASALQRETETDGCTVSLPGDALSGSSSLRSSVEVRENVRLGTVGTWAAGLRSCGAGPSMGTLLSDDGRASDSNSGGGSDRTGSRREVRYRVQYLGLGRRRHIECTHSAEFRDG
ncbi:hypothetical protein OH76DRAFT_1014428 [Lentinus brumalis]|uniref:Uncharacterized protein n=1 Tax=Lentinus brumalis TaxID=2498619 RepID=A0A371CYE4_9APHY|nr:hypothetical protein OH76DRAFT_1014428 [Polyporus brumalis]